jgi:hypothetical protein
MKAPLQTKLKTSSNAPPTFAPVRRGLLQRKCACGGTPGPSGECESCRKKKRQRRSENLDASSISPPPSSISEVPPIVHEALHSPGQPLDAQTRAFMEPRFGHDFTHVPVHSNPQAEQFATAVGPLAYSVGNNGLFGNDPYQPILIRSLHSLPYELAHTAQPVNHDRIAPTELRVGRTDGIFERQADAAAYVTSMPLGGPNLPAPAIHFPVQPVLQQQSHSKAEDEIVASSAQAGTPDIECEPNPKTWDEINSIPGVGEGTLGVTLPVVSEIKVQFPRTPSGMCKLSLVSPWALTLDPFMYTKAGSYADGKEDVQSGPCKGDRILRKRKITEAMAKKIKQGESEHCQDNNLAFSLSFARYNQAVRDLEGDYSAEGTSCAEEFTKRFEERTGIKWEDQNVIAKCLRDKSRLRDSREWHNPAADTPVYAIDCSLVTYTYDPVKLKDVGTHPSSEIVKDCGEK